MSNQFRNTYIPYQATAEAMVEADNSVETYLRSLFPDVRPETIESFRLYTIGRVLDGIHYGLELSDAEPMEPLEAYKLGSEDGFKRGHEHGNNGGEI